MHALHFALARFAALLPLLIAAEVVAGEPANAQAVRGVVFRADGAPAANAEIWAIPRHQWVHEVRARSNADGEYELHLTPGRWWVRARLKDEGGEVPGQHNMIRVKAGKPTATPPIHLQPRGTLAGRVRDKATGQPIANAKLYLDSGQVVTTDAAGRYATGGLPREDHELFVVAPGYQRMRVLFDNTLRTDSRLDFIVPAGRRVVGTVTDPDGQPIADACVYRPASGTIASLRGLSTFTNAQGAFVYDGLKPGVTGGLAATAPGYHQAEFTAPADHDPDKPIRVVLRPKTGQARSSRGGGPPTEAIAHPLRNLAGRVTRADGQPVAKAKVSWGATEYETIHRKHTTGDDGRFTLKQVPDRDGYVTVIAPGYAPRFAEVSAGLNNLDVTLEPGVSAEGVVVDPAGNPIANVWVVPQVPSPDPSLCNPLYLGERSAHTGADGKFRIAGLPKGPVLFDFMGTGLSDRRNAKLDMADGINRVVMHATGAVRGRVTDGEGKPVKRFRVLVNFPRERKPDDELGGYFAGYCWPGLTFTDERGEFQVTDLVAGSVVRVTIMAEGHGVVAIDRAIVRPVTALKPAHQLGLQLTPPHSGAVAVTGQAKGDERPKPLAGAKVMLLYTDNQSVNWRYAGRSWAPSIRGRTDAQGVARFEEIPFDEAVLLIDAKGFGRQHITWRAIGTTPIQLEPEAVLTGTLIGPNGKPLAEGWVQLYGESGNHFAYHVRPGDRGRYRIDRLPADTYRLSIHHDRSELLDKQIDLQAGQTLTIDLPEKQAER